MTPSGTQSNAEEEVDLVEGKNGVVHRFPKLTEDELEDLITTMARVFARRFLEEVLKP